MIDKRRKKIRQVVLKEGPDTTSSTQPNLSYDIGQIVKRLQSGQSVPTTEMPIFLDQRLPELVGFENMSKLEQIDFARKFKQSSIEMTNKEIEDAKKLVEQQKAVAVAEGKKD